MTLEIVNLNARDLGYLCAHLREDDLVEADAMLGTRDPVALTVQTLHATSVGWIARERRERTVLPMVAWGLEPVTVRCWRVWLVASRHWARAHRQVSMHIVSVMVPMLISAGVLRLEALSVASHRKAHIWMERMGARREGPAMRNYGQNGEDFYRYVWLREDLVNGGAPAGGLAGQVADAVQSTLVKAADPA